VGRARSRRTARALATAAVVAAALAGCGGGSGAPPEPGASIGQPADATLPAAVMAAPLVSSTGARFDVASLAGKVVVISDIMTLCQETCPLDTADVVAAAQAVQHAGLASKVAFLSITIDPQRDTVARLAAYRRLYGPAPGDWQVVTGAPATLAAFWQRLGVYIQRVPDTAPAPRDWLTGRPLTYDLTHSDEVFFLDPHGHERFLLEGAPHLAAGAPLPATLRHFLDATGRANLIHPDAAAWTLPQELQVLSWLVGRRITAAS
jgi:cytochrome oxidase Cu insertion factor (SCO1/SenC/PrrC family)